MGKGGIAKKIIWTYLLLALILFLVIGTSFYAILKNNIVEQALDGLVQEASMIVGAMDNRMDHMMPEPYRRMFSVRMVTRNVRSSYVILNHQGQVLDTNLTNLFKSGKVVDREFLSNIFKGNLEKGDVIRLENKDYALVGVPLKDNRGAIILFTELQDLTPVTMELIGFLLRSIIIASIITVIVGYFFAERLSKPIRNLEGFALKISQRKFNERISIKTKDELEDLAESINSMADRLQEYDEAQRHFLQNISHELKTPLMSIQGYAEGIIDGVFTGDEINSSLNIVVKETERLKLLVNELIYLSKLEDVDQYKYSEVSLPELLEEAIVSVRGLEKDKRIKIELNCQDDVKGYFDKEKIYRALLNILSNSIRYSNSRINIGIKTLDNFAILDFTDDGPGFKEGEETMIFYRFYKGFKGSTGLGLTIAKTIIEGHGGSIVAGNSPEGGASFTIKIPLTINE